jgi:hypothetical protein
LKFVSYSVFLGGKMLAWVEEYFFLFIFLDTHSHTQNIAYCVLREELFVVTVVVMAEDWLHVRGDFFAHIRGNLKVSLHQFLLEDEENSPQPANMLRAFT